MKYKPPAIPNNMNKQTQAIYNDMGQLADDAQALMSAKTDAICAAPYGEHSADR